MNSSNNTFTFELYFINTFNFFRPIDSIINATLFYKTHFDF